MSGPYGYPRDEFLELEPDEVAAAILPAVKTMADAHDGSIDAWNVINDARILGEREMRVVAEGWQWLVTNGFVAPDARTNGSWALTRRGHREDIRTYVVDARALGLLRDALLDSDLRRVALPSFRRGQHDLAVLAAMREVEERVRHASRLRSESGVPLMRKAFGTGGPLEDRKLDAGERKARADLFAGAMGVHRNATGHQAVDYREPQEAAEAILFANNLLRHLARAAAATRGRGRPATRRTRQP